MICGMEITFLLQPLAFQSARIEAAVTAVAAHGALCTYDMRGLGRRNAALKIPPRVRYVQ